MLETDSYSAIYAQMQRDFFLTVGPIRNDPIYREAVQNAVLVDWAIENADEDFKRLERDTRRLRR